MEKAHRQARFGVIAALLLLVGAVLQAKAYWPGLLHVDASIQYDEAMRGTWDDWHAPLMSWIWRQLYQLYEGPAPIFLLQTGLYWAGFSLFVVWALRQGRPVAAVLIALCALFPLSLALLGSVLKDCLMVGAVLCAAGLLALVQQRESRTLRVVAIALLFMAAGLRSNAFLACLPILVLLLPGSWRATPVRLVLVSVVMGLALLATMPLANRALKATPSDVQLSLIIYDLAGITRNSRENVFPPLPVADPLKATDQCYTTRFWDTFGWWHAKSCGIAFVQVRDSFRSSGKSPYVHWVGAVVSRRVV